jgi:putative acetyltransferase
VQPIIRPYEPDDQPAVRNLFVLVNRALAPPGMYAQFEAYIELSLREEIERIPEYYAARQGSFWVAIDRNTLVGNFGLEAASDGALELRRMYVDPGARRRGVARAMLMHAEGIARAANCGKIVLGTSELQTDAIEFYRAAGYRLVREEVGETLSNKTVGGLKRYRFEKELAPALPSGIVA